MAGFSFSELDKTSSKKSFEAGNHKLKLNDIFLEQPSFLQEKNGYFVKLNLETEPIEGDFKGFQIDKDDESKGFYKGQQAFVRSTMYAYQDSVIEKNGKKFEIKRNRDMLMLILNLCKAFDCVDWCQKVEKEHGDWFQKEQIEKIYELFRKEKPFKDKYAMFCVAGKEYINKDGYVAQDLFLAKPDKGFYSIAKIGDSKLQEFDEKFVIKTKDKPSPKVQTTLDDDPFGSSHEEEGFPVFKGLDED